MRFAGIFMSSASLHVLAAVNTSDANVNQFNALVNFVAMILVGVTTVLIKMGVSSVQKQLEELHLGERRTSTRLERIEREIYILAKDRGLDLGRQHRVGIDDNV